MTIWGRLIVGVLELKSGMDQVFQYLFLEPTASGIDVEGIPLPIFFFLLETGYQLVNIALNFMIWNGLFVSLSIPGNNNVWNRCRKGPLPVFFFFSLGT